MTFRGKGSSQCKGPESGESLACSRKDISVAEQSKPGRVGGRRGQEGRLLWVMGRTLIFSLGELGTHESVFEQRSYIILLIFLKGSLHMLC